MALGMLTSAPSIAVPRFEYEGLLAHPSGTVTRTRPNAVSVDPHLSEVCVTDESSPSLLVYNHANVLVYRTGHISDVAGPRDGCIDADGGLVYTGGSLSHDRTIRRLNFLGEPLPYEAERPHDDWSPAHLRLLSSGDYLTIDDRTGLMAKHDSQTGALIWQRELNEHIPEFTELVGRPAEAPDGTVYLPGGQARAVFVFSSDGEYLTSFGRPGSGRGEFSFPVDVAFVPEGVIVLDRMRHTVLLFDSNHEFICELGGFGGGRGGLYHPLSIAVSPAGLVYVAQGYQGRVQVFSIQDPEIASG